MYLAIILTVIIAINAFQNNHILKKKHVVKRNPPPKKLAQHAPYYAYQNAIRNKISYHDSYNYLYKK